jgi:hypothetical protein
MSSVHSSPPPQAVEVWKQKYQALEASTALALSRHEFDYFHLIVDETYLLGHSLGATQRSLGHGLWRTVAMFHSVRDLVAESDHRAEHEANGEDVTQTDEYVALHTDILFSLIPLLP